MISFTFLAFVCVCISLANGYALRIPGSLIKQTSPISRTSLFAHHVQKKIIKRKMDRRPKKHRLSDINRKNVNHDKCITKVSDAPADYTLLKADDYNQIRNNALNFWENGDSAATWLELTEDDMVITFSQNRDPLPEGGVLKVPKLARSGTA